jgi:hypothetical protein
MGDEPGSSGSAEASFDKEEHQVATEERLQLAERMLRDSADRIASQTRRIAEMKGDGFDTGSAERALRTFQAIQLLFKELHASTAEASRVF